MPAAATDVTLPSTGAAPASLATQPVARGRRGLTIALLVGSLLIILGGVAFIALSLAGGSDPPPAVPTGLLPGATTTTTSSTPTSGVQGKDSNRRKSPAGNPSTASDAAIRRALRSLMRRHYTAVDTGDWSVAYRTLSSHKRAQKRDEAARNGLASGLAQYRSQFQGELQGQLRMSDLKVHLKFADPDRREAEFDLSIPKNNGGCYSGTTWAVYERRRGWLFDIGASGHADRPTSGTGVLQSRSAPC